MYLEINFILFNYLDTKILGVKVQNKGLDFEFLFDFISVLAVYLYYSF